MKPYELLRLTEKLIKDNAPVILTGLGVSGVISTAYFAHQAGFKTASERAGFKPTASSFKEKYGRYWRNYIPAGISGTLAVVAIVGASRVGSRRSAAVSAAYAVTERAFTEYRDKVTEKFGDKKEQSVRDEIAQDHIRRDQPAPGLIIGTGSVLCYEMYTGRYFSCDMETLRRAVNDINAKLVGGVYATLSDFYYIVGLPWTSESSNIGWESDKPLKMDFSAVLTEDNRPCIAFEYNYTKPL